jgi:hypothetical protein
MLAHRDGREGGLGRLDDLPPLERARGSRPRHEDPEREADHLQVVSGSVGTRSTEATGADGARRRGPVNIDPIARRVARRHVAQNTRIEFSGGGRIPAVELRRMLEPTAGVLVKLRFRPSLIADPNGVEWEALDENAAIVNGTLVLHAAVSDSEVRCWTEVTVDPSRTVLVDPADLRLIESPDQAAERVAVEYQRRTRGLEHVEHDDDGQCDAPEDELPETDRP